MVGRRPTTSTIAHFFATFPLEHDAQGKITRRKVKRRKTNPQLPTTRGEVEDTDASSSPGGSSRSTTSSLSSSSPLSRGGDEAEEAEVVEYFETEVRYSRFLLSFAPIGDNDSLTADSHLEYVTHVLQSYGKTWANVVALIGDNCATNKAFATKAKANFIGCASHRFNLAIKHTMLMPYEELINKVQALMKKLRNIRPSAKLRKLTKLRAKTCNATRWSSTYEMLRRYFAIKEFLPKLNMEEIDDLMPSQYNDRELKKLYEMLSEMDEVTKDLQYDHVTLADVRTVFDIVIEAHEDTEKYLAENAPIVHSYDFESAVVKPLLKREFELSRAEELALMPLEVSNFEPAEISRTALANMSVMQRARERKRRMKAVTNGYGVQNKKYLDPHFLVPTSNICERFFSKAGFTLTDRRLNILPSNFESQLFLHVNNHMWDISDINSLVIKDTDA